MGHKTLHESAAEILAASVANAGREPLPMAAMMNPPADLGGEMMTGDVVSPGALTAQQVMPAEKPGQTGAPAEAIKQLPAEGEEVEEALADVGNGNNCSGGAGHGGLVVFGRGMRLPRGRAKPRIFQHGGTVASKRAFTVP